MLIQRVKLLCKSEKKSILLFIWVFLDIDLSFQRKKIQFQPLFTITFDYFWQFSAKSGDLKDSSKILFLKSSMYYEAQCTCMIRKISFDVPQQKGKGSHIINPPLCLSYANRNHNLPCLTRLRNENIIGSAKDMECQLKFTVEGLIWMANGAVQSPSHMKFRNDFKPYFWSTTSSGRFLF